MAAKSFSQGTFAASEIHVYIQDDNHDKENIEDQDNIEKISSQLAARVTLLARLPVNYRKLSQTLNE